MAVVQNIFLLALLLSAPALATKVSQAEEDEQPQVSGEARAGSKAGDRAGRRLVRTEMVVSSGAEVSPLADSAPGMLEAASCTKADVFGPDSAAWPTTVADAKTLMESICTSRGYSGTTCTSVIGELFQKNNLTASNENLVVTAKFCAESVELLRLDRIEHANATNASSLISADWRYGDKNTRCADGQKVVWYNYFVGYVCPQCYDKSGSQVAACLRQCKYGDSNCAQCFPSSAAVSVQLPDGSVATQAMEQLRVGDVVYTGEGFSKIFAFMDHASDTEAEYVQLRTASGYELSLTADHIVYAHAGQTPVLAGTIIEGDLLWTASGVDAEFVPSQVVRVQHGLERGMHAPLTEQGSVVVNGVLSSSYAKLKSLRWGARVLVSGHDLGKYVHEPLRFACSLMPSLCDREWHSAEGRHVWTQLLLDRLGWLQAMNSEHSDIRSALVAEPSIFSWLASFAQLFAAVLLSATFGQASRVALLGVVAAALATTQRKVRAKKD